MAKQMTIKDGKTGTTYLLEYTRKSVETMEKQGFSATELEKKPMTYLPALFAGAFLTHHRWVKREVIDDLYERMPRKEELIPKLIEMYNEPIVALLENPDQTGDEGNVDWTADS